MPKEQFNESDFTEAQYETSADLYQEETPQVFTTGEETPSLLGKLLEEAGIQPVTKEDLIKVGLTLGENWTKWLNEPTQRRKEALFLDLQNQWRSLADQVTLLPQIEDRGEVFTRLQQTLDFSPTMHSPTDLNKANYLKAKRFKNPGVFEVFVKNTDMRFFSDNMLLLGIIDDLAEHTKEQREDMHTHILQRAIEATSEDGIVLGTAIGEWLEINAKKVAGKDNR